MSCGVLSCFRFLRRFTNRVTSCVFRQLHRDDGRFRHKGISVQLSTENILTEYIKQAKNFKDIVNVLG